MADIVERINTESDNHLISAMVWDWDADGDLDMIVGAKDGKVYLAYLVRGTYVSPKTKLVAPKIPSMKDLVKKAAGGAGDIAKDKAKSVAKKKGKKAGKKAKKKFKKLF